MKRGDVIKKLKRQAKKSGVGFEEFELTKHTGFRVGGKRSTLGRHSEIDESDCAKVLGSVQ